MSTNVARWVKALDYRSASHAFDPCHNIEPSALLLNQPKSVESTSEVVSLSM